MDHDVSAARLTPEQASLWDDAHTDYGLARRPRPAPRGLAASDAEWRSFLEGQTPNGWLLRSGSLLETLASGRPIYLMHTTTYLDQIRASRQLYQAAGCLVGALYCAPLMPEPAGLRPHNLGAWLLEAKPHTRTIVFEVACGRPVPALGIDYLRLGEVHLRTYLGHLGFLLAGEDDEFRREAVHRVRQTARFLDLLLACACGTSSPPAGDVLDQLAAARGQHDKYRPIADLHRAAEFTFLQQPRRGRYGTAVPAMIAAEFIDGDDFLLVAGDDLLLRADGGSDLADLVAARDHAGTPAAIAAATVPGADAHRYGVLATRLDAHGNRILDVIIEKPSDYQDAIAHINVSRTLLPGEFVTYLDKLACAANGEYQATDAIAAFARDHDILVRPVTGRYYDCGNPAGWLTANLAAAHARDLPVSSPDV